MARAAKKLVKDKLEDFESAGEDDDYHPPQHKDLSDDEDDEDEETEGEVDEDVGDAPGPHAGLKRKKAQKGKSKPSRPPVTKHFAPGHLETWIIRAYCPLNSVNAPTGTDPLAYLHFSLVLHHGSQVHVKQHFRAAGRFLRTVLNVQNIRSMHLAQVWHWHLWLNLL